MGRCSPGAAPAATYRPFGAVRLCLALMVMAQHFQYLLPAQHRAPFHALGLGVVAVSAFFALSGFIIADAFAHFYRDRPLAFLANRALRVVPPYLLALALSVLVHQLLWQSGRLALWDYAARPPLDGVLVLHSLLALLPGGGGYDRAFAFIPFVWSLRVEIGFYLIAALAVAARRHAPAWPSDRWMLPIGVLAGSLACLLAIHSGHAAALRNAPFFLLGWSLQAAPRHQRAVALPCIAASWLGCMHALATWPQANDPSPMLQMVLLTGLLAVLLQCGRQHEFASRLQRMDSRLGALSYPLYLNHYAVGILAYDLAPSGSVALWLAAMLASLPLAVAANICAETPLRRIRSRIRLRHL